MRHHIFLPSKYRYRQWRSCFDGMIENGEIPKHRDGKFMFEMTKNINIIFGKPFTVSLAMPPMLGCSQSLLKKLMILLFMECEININSYK
jgi:hypothetical protein